MRISKAAIVEVACRATVLKRKIGILTKEYEECKDLIRPWATAQYETVKETDPSATMVELPTSEGTLTVTFPRPTPEVLEGMSLDMLVKRLPPEKVGLVVVTELAVTKGFRDCWNAPESPFTKAERAVIEEVIAWKPATPRIEPAKA